MKALKIVREGFDSLENRNPWYTEDVCYFIDSDKTKEEKVTEYLSLPQKQYKGWDGEWYPKYRVVEIELC